MMQITQGNILKADAEALVNTVNCIGFMGKGIALQFKKAFPENFKAYARACRAEEVKTGKMFVFETGDMLNPKYIINFPTKNHWRSKSKIEDIDSGLEALVKEVRERNIKSIAVPPLGCGLGGLQWSVVRPRIERAFRDTAGVDVIVFEPKGAPEARTMPIRTERPNWTPARALLVQLMKRYSQLSYRLTLLEIQKLAYFLQVAGEPLRLKYDKGLYGPYAPILNKVLERIEGHFTQGYGDTQKPDVEIDVLPSADKDALTYLESHSESLSRLRKVANLVEGFETPYGLELLSSVHWVATNGTKRARSVDDAIDLVHSWNERKRRLLKSDHIRIAWKRLEEDCWFEPANDEAPAT